MGQGARLSRGGEAAVKVMDILSDRFLPLPRLEKVCGFWNSVKHETLKSRPWRDFYVFVYKHITRSPLASRSRTLFSSLIASDQINRAISLCP